MKLDKETLSKHRFWIALAMFVPLVLIAVAWLGTGVAGEVEAQRAKTETHRAELNKLAAKDRLAGAREIALLEDKRKLLLKRQEDMWEGAYKLQAGLASWPKSLDELALSEEKYGRKSLTDRPMGADLHPELRATYAQANVYLPQYDELAKIFRHNLSRDGKVFTEPVHFKGGWQNVLRYVSEWKKEFTPPSVEEVWLAQEDLWVQRELLHALLEANRSVSRFQKVPTAEGLDDKDPLQGSFQNPNWRLDLIVAKKDQGFVVRGKITNPEKTADGQARPPKVQQIEKILFWLKLHDDRDARPVLFEVQGGALAPGKSWEFKEAPIAIEIEPKVIAGVEQVLDERSSPVKRIDAIALGQQSHRTHSPLLKARRFSGVPTTATIPAKAGTAPAPAPGSAAIPSGLLTDNGLVRYRYSNITEQVARMPIGLVLIVDQAHIPEVQAALANSKLRIQPTQLNWQHYRGTLGTADGGPAKPDPKGIEPKGGKEQTAANLVELSFCGIASLYEQPRKPAAAPVSPKEKDKDKDKEKDKGPNNPKK